MPDLLQPAESVLEQAKRGGKTAGSRPADLAARKADSIPTSAGSETMDVTLNQGLGFMDGKEAYGKTASLSFTVMSTIKPGAITERTTWRGNLKIKMDVQ